jgi:hypothetical protein
LSTEPFPDAPRLDVLDGGMSLEVPEHRVIALWQPKLHENSLRRPPTCGITDEPRQLPGPVGPAGGRWSTDEIDQLSFGVLC